MLAWCSGGFDLRDPATWTRRDAGVAFGVLAGRLIGSSADNSSGPRVSGAMAGGLLEGEIGSGRGPGGTRLVV